MTCSIRVFTSFRWHFLEWSHFPNTVYVSPLVLLQFCFWKIVITTVYRTINLSSATILSFLNSSIASGLKEHKFLDFHDFQSFQWPIPSLVSFFMSLILFNHFQMHSTGDTYISGQKSKQQLNSLRNVLFYHFDNNHVFFQFKMYNQIPKYK